MEGAIYYYYGFPKNPVNDWLVAEHTKRFKRAARLLHRRRLRAAMAIVAAIKKAGGTDTEKLIAAMEGMSFDTPKGKMTFRKEDHQALQAMYQFRMKAAPAGHGTAELVREISGRTRSAADQEQAIGNSLSLREGQGWARRPVPSPPPSPASRNAAPQPHEPRAI